MFFDLLIKIPFKGYSLNDFAADLVTLIRCDQWEHQQDASLGKYHFRLVVMGVAIIVSAANDARFEDYHFGIRFEPEAGAKGGRLPFDGLADCLARRLAADGYEVVRVSHGNAERAGVRYFRNPEAGSRLWKPVIAEDVDGNAVLLDGAGPSRTLSLAFQ
jgi:hypothetical protein